MAHAKQLGSFRHRQPLAILFGGTIGMDAMLVPQGTYACAFQVMPCPVRMPIRFSDAAMS